jgi:asparagine synthase (glutamine-hydrolysing)
MSASSASWASPVEARHCRQRDRLAHRGPTTQDRILRDGHCFRSALAILDPVRRPPADVEPRQALLTHNEIYNFRELAAELAAFGYTFATRTDTEVLIASFEHWGLDAVLRLRGMFAFAMWSEEMRECVLVRDRLGVKPLYYAL